LGPNYIFMEDGLKVYLGHTRLPRLEHGVRGFNWPPFLPNLNVIEKAWQWMKEELKKIFYEDEDIRAAIQAEWDKVTMEEIRTRVKEMPTRCERLRNNGGKAIKSALW
ncbi:hypothetical protein DL98DRAFT_435387, partial [Cadophora sp. DSE1049]